MHVQFISEKTIRHVVQKDTVKTGILYLLLLAGGLWHVMDVFQGIMNRIAGLMMMLISFWIIYEIYRNGAGTASEKTSNRTPFLRTGIWLFIVFTGSIVIEIVGVETGWIFGYYNYGGILWPEVRSVPVVIGFAWINMMVSSAVLAHMIMRDKFFDNTWLASGLIAVLMVVFDLVLEPAATKLGYWSWNGTGIPLRNYLAWFVISYVFAFLGFRTAAFARRLPRIVVHAYFAQLGYFVLVNFK